MKAIFAGVFALCALSAALAQDGPLYLTGDKATDSGNSHPLSYWTTDPISLEKGSTLCVGCAVGNGNKKVVKSDYRITSETHKIGQLAGHDVIEILYHIKTDVLGFRQIVFWRIVLAATKPGMYSEIYRLETEEETLRPLIEPSRIVRVGTEDVLATFDPFDGSGGLCSEGYWWFDQAGPHLVNFQPVYQEIEKQLPRTSQYRDGCWTKYLNQQQIKTVACRKSSDYRCLSGAEDFAMVVAHFTMHGATAVPLKIEITPDQ